MSNPNDNLHRLYQNGLKHFSMPDFDTFKQDMMDEQKRRRFYTNMQDAYSLPDFDTFSKDIGTVTPLGGSGMSKMAGAANMVRSGVAKVAGLVKGAGDVVGQLDQSVQTSQTGQPDSSGWRSIGVGHDAFMKQMSVPLDGNSNSVIEKARRTIEPFTEGGRARRKVKKFEQQLHGVNNDIMAVNYRAAQDAAAAGSTEKEPVKHMDSPQPYGVRYEKGKAIPQWVLPDGSVTENITEVQQAEYDAQQASLEHEWRKHMEKNGLDPDADYDVQLSQALERQKQLEKDIEQREKELDEEYRQRGSGVNFIRELGMQTHSGLSADYIHPDGPEARNYYADKKYNSLTSALRVNRNIIQTLKDKHNGNQNGFWHSFSTSLSDGYSFSGGLSESRDARAKSVALGYIDAINRKRKSGAALTPDERDAEAVLQVFAQKNDVENTYGTEYGAWSRAGKMGAKSIELLPDFFLGGMGMMKGAATGTLARMGVDAMASGLKRTLVKGTGIAMGTLAGGALMSNTIQAPRMLAKAGDSADGQVAVDKNGDYVIDGKEGFGTALLKAERELIAENASEAVGEFFPLAGPALMALGNKVGLSKIARTFTKAQGTQWYRQAQDVLARMGYNGILGEGIEEYVGNGYSALMGDIDALKSMGDLNTHMDIWLGTVTLGGILNAPQTLHTGYYFASYAQQKHKLRNSESRAQKAIGASWAYIKDKLENCTNEDMPVMVTSLLSDGTIKSVEERSAFLNYIKELQRMRGFNIGDIAAAKGGEKSGKLQETEREFGESYEQGYNEQDKDAVIDAQKAYELYRERLASALSADVVEDFDRDPIGALKNTFDEDVRAIAIDYLNAKFRRDGIIQRSNDDMDGLTGQGDDPIGRAVMKYQDREVEVLSGRVVMTDDGAMVDNARSDASIVVRDVATGKVEMVSPEAILTYEDGMEGASGRSARATLPGAEGTDGAERTHQSASLPDEDNAGNTGEVQQAAPQGDEFRYGSGEIRIVNPDGTSMRGWLTGEVDEQGRHEYFVEGDLSGLHYATDAELDGMISEYRPDNVESSESSEQIYGDDRGNVGNNSVTLQPETENGYENGSEQNNDGRGYPRETDGSRMADDTAGAVASDRDRGDIRVYEEGLGSSRDEHSEYSERNRREAESERLVGIARNNGQYRSKEEVRSRGKRYAKPSGESEVIIDRDNHVVYKIKDPYAKSPMKGNVQPEEVIYEHLVHNKYFPETRYGFEGISDDLGDVRMVLSQPLIESAGQPTKEQVEAALAEKGLLPEDRYTYGNDEISVTDVTGDNALLGADGKVYFIDPIINFKKPAREILGEGSPEDSKGNGGRPVRATLPGAELSERLHQDAALHGEENSEGLEALTVLQRVPVDENGDPVLTHSSVDAGTGWDAAVEFFGGEADAQAYIDAQIKGSEGAIKAAEKSVDKVKPTGGMSKFREDLKNARAAVESAKSVLAKWQAIAEIPARKKAEEEAARAAEAAFKTSITKGKAELEQAYEEVKDVPEAVEILSNMEPQSMDEVAAMLLMSSKVLWKDEGVKRGVQRMLGYGEEERKGMFGLFATSKNGGETLERLAEDKMQALCRDYGVEYDNYDALTALTDVLGACRTRGDLYKYIQNKRIEQARQAKDDYDRQMEEDAERWSQEMYHMSVSDREAYEENILSEIEKKELTDAEVEEMNATFADEIIERQRNEENIGNEQRGAAGALPSGTALLQGERTDHGGRISDAPSGERGVKGDGLRDREDGTSSEGPRGRGDLSPEEAADIISKMEMSAVNDPQIPLSPESWQNTFGLRNSIDTPLGKVKMGEGQYQKLVDKERSAEFGMVVGTLQDPDVVFIEPSEAKEGQTTERDFSYVFVKTFIRNGQKFKYYTSVSVLKDGMEVSVSSHIASKTAIMRKLQGMERAYTKQSLLPNSSEWHLAEHPMGVPDLLPTQGKSDSNLETSAKTEPQQPNNAVSSDSSLSTDEQSGTSSIEPNGESTVSYHKVNNSTSEKQGSGTKSSVQPSDSKREQTIQTAVDAASAQVNTEPTPAQAEAGNYKKGHVTIGEFDITIENPAGSVRKGVDADGKEWSTIMANTYGYIKGTEGADGDHIDVFLHSDMDQWNGRKVYVVDQTNTDGSFDEHKVMLGFNDENKAFFAYLSNYNKTWADTHPGLRISEASIEDFNKWVESSHRKTKPFADYSKVKKAVSASLQGAVADNSTINAVTEERKRQNVHRVGMSSQPNPFHYFSGSIRELIDVAKGAASGLYKKIVAPINIRLQQDLASYGIDISADYRHIIDNNAIRHAIKSHGGKQEEKRGQIPLVDSDFERIEDVVSNYDHISIENGKRHNFNIIYSKKYDDGTTIFVEEKRDGRKELAAITMWKKKNSTRTDANQQVTPISDLSEVSDGKGSDFATEKQGNKAESSEHSEQPAGTGKIEDFGEKIAGARKDMLRDVAKSVENVTVQSLIELPMSKVFKRPPLKKMLDGGVISDEDAVLAEAIMQGLIYAQKKPALTRRLSSKREIAAWAEETYAAIKMLGEILSGDEARKAAAITKREAALAERLREVNAHIAKMREWNPGKEFEDLKSVPDAVEVVRRVLDGIGYKTGDKIDLPLTRVELGSSGRGYLVSAPGKQGSYWFKHYHSTLDEAIDTMILAAKLSRGDMDVELPQRQFGIRGVGKVHMEPTGKYVVDYFAKNGYDIKEVVFDTKEKAEAYAKEKNGRFYEQQRCTNEYDSYQVVVINPLTGKSHTVKDGFSTRLDASAWIDERPEEVNSTAIDVIYKENGTKGMKRPHFYVTSTYSRRGGKMIYSVVSDDKTNPWPVVKDFENRKEAESWLNDNIEQLEAQRKQRKEAERAVVYYNTAGERLGEDYRKGKDATPELFGDTFGFRGVQFGNWTNDADRQAALNQAYDALMDLSQALGLSGRALSLDGELGLAFGARGGGSAAAHYEPVEVVINLTKTQGAGALAHEWWHAVDNFLSRRAGVPMGYASGRNGIDKMNREVGEAVERLMAVIDNSDYAKRSRDKGDYWGRPTEVMARLFESWVAWKLGKNGQHSPFLSTGINPASQKIYQALNYLMYKADENRRAEREQRAPQIMSEEEFGKTPESLRGYPYPTEVEIGNFAPRIESLFNTLSAREAESGSMVNERGRRYARMQTTGMSLFDWADSEERTARKAAVPDEKGMEAESANTAIDEYASTYKDYLEQSARLEKELAQASASEEEASAIREQMASVEDEVADARERLADTLRDYYVRDNTPEDAERITRAMIDRVQAEIDVRVNKEQMLRDVLERDSAPKENPEAEKSEDHTVKTAGGKISYNAIGHLPDAKAGEFAYVERQFSRSGEFMFTGNEYVKDRGDVAYMFRSLEDYSVEHVFAVLVKDGRAKVLHIGMGGPTASFANMGAIRAGYDAFGADKIYLVHNHPSGNLTASIPDMRLMKRLEDAFGDKVETEGIIMDTTSGRYTVFSGKRETGRPDRPQEGGEATVEVMRFDRSTPHGKSEELIVIRMSEDVARFVSGQRLGTGKKVSYVVLANNNEIVGNFHTEYDSLTAEGLSEEIASAATKFGGTKAIVYGNVDIKSAADLSRDVARHSLDGVKLLDVIEVTNGLSNSALDSGIISEEAEAYRAEVREPMMSGYGREEFDALRERAVAERGIVMPGLNEAEVRVVEVPRHDFADERPIAVARKWVKENLVGKHMLTDSNGIAVPYEISGRSIDKYLSATAIDKSENLGVHLSVLRDIQKMAN